MKLQVLQIFCGGTGNMYSAKLIDDDTNVSKFWISFIPLIGTFVITQNNID